MSTIEILESAQYVIDKDGHRTAVLLDLPSWETLRQILLELMEDEMLGELMIAVKDDEKLSDEAALEAYQVYLQDPQP